MLPNFLKQRAYLTPNRTALVFKDGILTFVELYKQVKETAQKLAGRGMQPEDTAAVLLKNRPQTVVILHALQQLRVRTLFLNHRLTTVEMQYQLQDSGAKWLITEKDFQEKSVVLKEKVQVIQRETLAALPSADYEEAAEFTLDDVCSIMYTSGTTGKPKGVLQTYGNHWWSAAGSALNLGLREEDVWLCAVPLFHISGFSILMRSVFYGMPVYLMEKFNEKEAVKLLQSGCITIMSVVANTLQRILNELGEKSLHPNVRCMLLGGGPAPRPLLEACAEKQISVFQSYGMTETSSQIVTLAPEDSLRKIGSAGKPLFPAQIRIVSEGRECKPFEHGEIAVKGPNVTIGYLNRPDANEKSFRDGWFFTGDIGYLDDEGFLYVMDRRSDLIISGGENIYPAEVEEVLLAHPDILEAGVVGMEDEKWGQVPAAFIVTKKEVLESELQAFCEVRLAKYKIPKKFFTVSDLPRNASNKLMRRKLLEWLPS
ncbi:o-succinylbenzoate--CoA ligase [Weizmannia acidilactici]|uniref:o-succinylbenzoate--CoA ligase n=1 Tax=Weizmannia acidilactici TaxID=2607726 RepID=UPI00124E414F|nr:o-succinylbenzoate--CoA ligase [Weizmannia acidilactici]GER72328.1 2-succinylbenzoate--CoA ligase [Weizmannia acidilactici]